MNTETLLAGTKRIDDLEDAWRTTGHGPRLRAVRRATERLRERFASGPRVVAVRTLPIATAPYPTKFAFQGAALSPAPFVTFTHRCVLVQFMQHGALKNLLFNPTDVDGSRRTPYYAKLIDQLGGTRVADLLSKRYPSLETQLAELGLGTADIDYIAYDHFHTQDLRKPLGRANGAQSPQFPNAVLLAPKLEWDDWDDPHPWQRAWFVRDGKEGVIRDRVALTTGDLLLGDGLLLMRTPGHTSGNQTLFINTEDGVWGISENGTCADNWSPLESRIPGLAAHCRWYEKDVVINANTPEFGAEQYTSMVLERTLVDRVKRAPAFVQMFPSREVTPALTAPALSPTVLHRAITSGNVVRPTRAALAAE
jgi:hypothetical protein